MATALLAVLTLALSTLPTAHADDDDEGKYRTATRVVSMPLYQQECAACHVAYPPGLLPARSWQRLMSQLPKHFGTDASLDAKTTQQLATWLSANAAQATPGRQALPEPAQDRITQSAWFKRQHDEVGASVWKRPAIKSPSNCIACHTRADQGDFNERFVRIPR
jgi:mono/diheme cytochrome c family protein